MECQFNIGNVDIMKGDSKEFPFYFTFRLAG